MSSSENTIAQIQLAFQERFWSDKAENKALDLNDYLAIWPDFEAVIARAFIEATGHATNKSDGEADSTNENDTVGHYVLGEELGRGGQGVVYKAVDSRLNRTVAIKLLGSSGFESADQLKRFRREAEVAAQLDHPGICGVHDAGIESGVAFIAMQYVEGQVLSKRLASARNQTIDGKISGLSSRESNSDSVRKKSKTSGGEVSSVPSDLSKNESAKMVQLVEGCARALHVAHQSGIIHRDVKPNNIMVTKDELPVLLDFGLAKVCDDANQSLTIEGELLGTPAYMSPEQLAAQRMKLDARTDVYSLGVTLFECLTSCRPFEEPTREGLYNAILTARPHDLRRLSPSISEDLAVVVQTAMARNRDDRYQTALEFAKDLRNILERKPISARPASPMKKLSRWAQRQPIVAAMSFIAFLTLVGSVALFYFKNEEANDALQAVTLESKLKTAALQEKSRAVVIKRSALEAEILERSAKEKALTEKNKKLFELERLSDTLRIDEATEAAEELWPAVPKLVPAMKQWLLTYQELNDSLTDHRVALTSLQSSALPYSEEDRQRDHREDFHNIERGLKYKKAAELRLAKTDVSADQATIRKMIAIYESDIAANRARIATQGSWDFGSDATTQWKHDALWGLVRGLEKFADSEHGIFVSMKNRLRFAESLHRKTIENHESQWQDAIKSIRTSKIYSGLELTPQLGLIPLGQDPQSGLQEFLHLALHVGDIPVRDKKGHLSINEQTGIVLVLIPKGKCWIGIQNTDKSGPNYDPFAAEREIPYAQKEVTIESSFFMSKYEMTQAQWQRSPASKKKPSQFMVGFRGKGMTAPVTGLHPVERVTWRQSSKVLGQIGLILPSNVDWEYSARARSSRIWGETDKISEIGKWGNILGAEAKGVFGDFEPSVRDSYVAHAPIGQFAANGFGLHDTVGNVSEWTSNWHNISQVVVRGGKGYFGNARYARIAVYFYAAPDQAENLYGVRPARQLDD